MPCDSRYLEPRDDERESYRVLSYLRELGLPTGRYDRDYGRVETLDADTAALCAWCRAHPGEVAAKSLELQLWWRDHQRDDARKARAAREDSDRARMRRQALAKLTPEEQRALGVKP